MAGGGQGGPADVGAVVARVLPVGPSDAAEETLHLLDGFDEHRLAQQNVHPRVQDGVHGGDADGLKVGVLPNVLHERRLVQLVHKDAHLQAGEGGERRRQVTQ